MLKRWFVREERPVGRATAQTPVRLKGRFRQVKPVLRYYYYFLLKDSFPRMEMLILSAGKKLGFGFATLV